MSRDLSRHQPTRRFSRRAADYVRYRPRYPRAILDTLVRQAGLTPAHTVADIGSGTGFSAEMFLRHGNTVYGIEPNAEMRAAGEETLSDWITFISIDATAEATTLPAASVDLIVAGQSFHWFDAPRAAAEFARILRPGGWIALIWNTRDNSRPFMQAYDALVERYSAEVREVQHANVTEADLRTVFPSHDYTINKFPYAQEFDADALIGRTFSSSYMPTADDPAAAALTADLRALFERFEQDGRVLYEYITELYLGR